MARPGDVISRVFRVLDAADAAVTGLTSSDFTFRPYQNALGSGDTMASWTHNAVLTELANGYYQIELALPSSPSEFFFGIEANSSSHFVSIQGIEGEVEARDIDALAGLIAKPVVTRSTAANTPAGTAVDIELVAYRARELVWSIQDSSGTGIDLTAYSALTFGVRATDQTDSDAKLDATDLTSGWSISGTAAGVLTVEVPDDAAFFAAIDEGANADSSVDLFYEITGTLGGEVYSLVRSSRLRLLRREVGTAP